MYRFIRSNAVELNNAEKMEEILPTRTGELADGCKVYNFASENGVVLGFVAASEEHCIVPTLRIISLRVKESMGKSVRDEVLEFLLRATVIEARYEGVYERITVSPNVNDIEYFEERGFTESENEEDFTLEYLLGSCRGYCPFCRAC